MTAFQQTAQLAVDQVEFDVHPTLDNKLVVHHDPTVDRMTNGTGAIANRSFADLAKLTIKGTETDRIPLLTDVINLFIPTSIDLRLEIKADADRFPYKDLEPKIARTLIDVGMQDRTTITSFTIDTLLSMQKHLPEVPLIWLIDRSIVRQVGDLKAVLQVAANRGITEIALHETDLGAHRMQIAHVLGLAVGAYAVNDEAAIRRMFALGITVFTTNRPDIGLSVRSELT